MVEDEPTIREVCRRVLSSADWLVDLAENGKMAQKMIEAKDYDLCLLDIRTPKMTGRELYEWILAAHPEFAKRVIFVSGDLLDGDTEDFVKATGRPFLSKPFSPGELLAIIREAEKN